ncbi:MAG: DrmB family protein [Solirubrobacteraceae bacterium]
MSARAHAQIRRSQAITTWGPGALIDLPRHSGIVGGLETWPKVDLLDEIADPRLTRKISLLTGVPGSRLYAPPAASTAPGETTRGIGVWRFPEWMLVQEDSAGDGNERSRRLVHRKSLDEKGKFDGRQVVPTRFVRACPRGHVSDLNWHWFVHGSEDACKQQLWLDERGTGGDLADLVVRCQCGKSRRMAEAAELELKPLGLCWGARPWLGAGSQEQCGLPSRLLIRTAANAYFPQVMSALSLPEHGTQLEEAVRSLWDDLQIVENSAELAFMRKKPKVATKLADHSNEEILATIARLKHGGSDEQPVKLVELDALLAAPAGYGDDVPIDPDFHARRLPESAWRSGSLTDPVAAIVQLHRLREVLALLGFTRFDAITPDIHGEYDSDVQRAELALDPQWFPAIENRGEGIFIQLDSGAVAAWLARRAVTERLGELAGGHAKFTRRRNVQRPFPGGPYVLLHTLSHLLVQSIAMRCGYPASSIRERVYVDYENGRFGLLLYTASSDAEGTLGGLVTQARHIGFHLAVALRAGGLCSNDPACAQHSPGEGMGGRWLHGAACHGCALIAETSCEMRNDYLDRALVVPTLSVPDAAFFPPVP